MKKLLPLLALFLQTDAEPDSQIKAQAEKTETLVETVYRHPGAKKVGDLMPIPFGEKVSYTITYRLNKRTREIRKVGLIIGYDRNGDEIPEYEFIRRFCDIGSSVETYAVFDVPHKLLYINSSRNNKIDSIVEGIYSIEGVWPMIPICEENKAKKSLRV